MDVRKRGGENFARIRREKGLIEERVEELSGFSPQYPNGFERGRRYPTILLLYELAQALDVTFTDILAEHRSQLLWSGK